MPVYLGTYPDCAPDRQVRFRRAIDSFLSQTWDNKELVIVSDGCIVAETIYKNEYAHHGNIKFKYILKQDLFSGVPREQALKMATGDVVCFLDADDYLQVTHLGYVASGFNYDNPDWIYFDHWIKRGKDKSEMKEVALCRGSAGVSSIAHRRDLDVSWQGCDGRGHEWLFIQRLIKASSNRRRAYYCSYIVCHIAGLKI